MKNDYWSDITSKNVVVSDEKWLYASCGNNQQNCRAWVSPGGDRPHLPSHTISEKKFHIADDVNQFLATYLNGIRRGSLTNELQRLRTDIQKIINRGGDYI